MKKTFLYILAVMTIGAGCRKTYNDTIQGQTPDQRISAALAAYQKKLTTAPYGWIFLESTTGIAYNQGVSQTGPKIVLAYYLQFTDSGRVSMISDFDPSMAATPKTSSYNVKELTRPALIFDTYSYLHVPCDPDPNVSHSPFGFGYGWGTDFEFSFSDSVAATALGDTIHFIGNLNNAQGMLIKATQAQQTAYLGGNVLNLFAGVGNLNNILQYFKRLSLGGVSYEIRIDAIDRTVTFSWIDGSGNVRTATVSYYILSTGIKFSAPIVNGSQTITGIDNLSWNAGSSTLTVSIGGQSGTITGANAPLAVDKGAATAWYQAANALGTYWYSVNGYHINGVDNAYRVDTLTGLDAANNVLTYYYMAYYPNFNPGIDFFGPIFLNHAGNGLDLVYGWGGGFSAKTDGHGVFSVAYTFGTPPTSGGGFLSVQQLAGSGGYYFVNTGPKTYDMVSKTDARIWISWTRAQ
jgi:hypothetical protein